MKKYVMQICIIAAVCLLGATAFCGYHIYDHYAHEAEQTEAFEQIAEVVEQAQTGEEAPQVPLNEEETILPEYGDLFLQNPDNARYRAVIRTELCLYAPDLKYFLVFGCYIGRMLLPKSKWEVKHYG